MISFRKNVKAEVDKILDDLDVQLIVDGKNLPLESHEIHQSRITTFKIDIQLGLRDILKRHPLEYDPELHYLLFTDEERKFFENYGRIEE